MTRITCVAVRGACLVVLVCGALLGASASASAALPPIKHVFVLIDENESASTTFGPSSPAPYLSKTLVSEGAYLPNYYGIGHDSLDNYIAMVSGQAPNPSTSADCGTFADFTSPTSMDSAGQENGEGCVYPDDVPTLMNQLDTAGLTWRAYEDSMGADPTRESPTCGHPAEGALDNTEKEQAPGPGVPFDAYATRHDPFVYFQYLIDEHPSECDANVVNLSQLPTDLESAATTPNYVFITPDLCDDGHDATCANGGPGGLAQADTFLQTWVPQITSSPAFKQNGLLIITFDEAADSDATACCGEVPGPDDSLPGITGPGGGDIGAVLLSPFIVPGTTTATPYNHYSMLGSVEDIFGLPRLADAVGTQAFGSDVFTQPNGPGGGTGPGGGSPPPATAPQDSGLKLKPASFAPHSRARTRRHTHKHMGTTIRYNDSQAAVTKLTIERQTPGSRVGHYACKALKPGHTRRKHSKPCTVTKQVAGFTHQDSAGANRVAFTGRLHGRSLSVGSYLLEATPTLGGLKGKTRTARFHIV